MFTPAHLFIALRYARSSKGNHFIGFINGFSVAGIALGLAALMTVSSVMNGFEDQLKQRVLGLQPHVLVSGLSQGQRAETLQLPAVEGIGQHIQLQALVQSSQSLKGVMAQGIEPGQVAQYTNLDDAMLVGRLADLKPGDYHVVMGRALAANLRLRVGDAVRIMTPSASTFTPFGRMPSQRQFTLSGVFQLGSELDDKVVLINRIDAGRLLRKPIDKVSQDRFYLHDAFDYQDLLFALEPFGVDVVDWRSEQGPLFDAVAMEKNMMAIMLLLIIAVAAFNIVSALVMVVSEKQGDIAILTTQGMQPVHIRWIFLVTGLYNGTKGTVIGLFLGLLLLSQLNNVLLLLGVNLVPGTGMQGLPILVEPMQISAMIGFSLLLCFLSTLYPAHKALSVSPANVLRHE